MFMIRYSLDNKRVIFFFLAVMLIGGVLAFGKLGKKEDAPFVIKQAMVFVQYPGASIEEVEEKVTTVVERKLQTMPNIYKITSDSYQGLAKIQVELLPQTPPKSIPQMWDVLRRKMLDLQNELPQGSRVVVNDDFGDVYGIYFGLVAHEGFGYEDLRKWSREIERQLSTVKGVQQVAIFGSQAQMVKVSLSLSQLATLNLTPDEISRIIGAQNKLIDAGERAAGELQIKFFADGVYRDLNDIRNQVVLSSAAGQIRLGDIAEISLEYIDPPQTMMFVNGDKSVGIAISSPSTMDVVQTGKNVWAKLDEIEKTMPVGLEIMSLYAEDKIASEANFGFLINLIESVLIVIFILLIAMGFKSSILIGSSLLFSISGTLLIMQFMGVGLNRTSLAGFIIAMGMLVDNAIVVTDNTRNNLKRGMTRRDAVIKGASAPMWGLLGATMIAVFSFLPLYMAKAPVAEIVQPLFVVIGVSLMLSWLLALSQTTTFAMFIFKEKGKDEEIEELYTGKFYTLFEKMLRKLIKRRFITISSMVVLLVLSLYVMGTMPQNFFPNLDKEYFRAEIFMPNGYNIRQTQARSSEIEQWLRAQKSVKTVSVAIGSSPPRYYLASGSFGPMPGYASILIELETKDSTAVVEDRFNTYVREKYPDLIIKSSLFKVSPVPEATIEIGFTGENIDTLTHLTNQVKDIMRSDSLVDQIRDSWGNKIAYLIPEYSVQNGDRLGVSRQMVAQSYSMINNGLPVGMYGKDDMYIPIMLQSNSSSEFNLNDVGNVPIIAPGGHSFPLSAVTSKIDYKYNYYYMRRFNHSRVMYGQCEPRRNANSVAAFNRIYERVLNEVKVPNGYKLVFKGERDSQDESNNALAANLPITFVLMYITLLFLFRGYKKPLVILAMIPLIFIGVVLGLVVSGKMFDFFCILGVLGLIGMNIKNAIVLVDQISVEMNNGLPPLEAVVSSAKSRLIPVVMASGTTILGMFPLLTDAMFGGMAATIMGGLFVATLLTMFILPVTYAIAFKIKSV
ncbi:MAG: efflux RND transporter permease subunit [Rikenellaceae bacterium]